MSVLDPFLDLFWDVHLSMILAFLGSCFHPPEVPVFEVLFLQGVARLKLSRVSRGRIYSAGRV